MSYFKLMFVFVLAGAVGFVVSFVDQRHKGNVAHFGDVDPGSRMEAQFEIVNTSQEILTLGGLEDACGVEVTLSGNGVIMPGKRGVMRLAATSVQRRGPGGASFDLVRTTGSRRSVENYRLAWTVVGDAWASPSAIWIGTNRAELVIQNLAPDATISIKSIPDGVSYETIANRVFFAADPERRPGRMGSALIEIAKRGKTIQSFVIPIYKSDLGGARLYPSQLLLTEQMHPSGEVLFRVIGMVPKGCKVLSTGSLAIDAVVVGDTVRLRTAIERTAKGQSVVSIVAANNEPIASAVVRVSR